MGLRIAGNGGLDVGIVLFHINIPFAVVVFGVGVPIVAEVGDGRCFCLTENILVFLTWFDAVPLDGETHDDGGYGRRTGTIGVWVIWVAGVG